MLIINQHMFKDREPLKDFVGNRLAFYGIPIEYKNRDQNVSEIVVSVYCPDHNLEFDHLVLDLVPRQASKIKLFTPISFSGSVEKYKAPKKVAIGNSSMTVMADTYGIEKIREIKPYRYKLPEKLSKWCLKIINRYNLDWRKIYDMPNNGNREKLLSSIDNERR